MRVEPTRAAARAATKRAAGAEAVPPRRRTRLQRIELPEACRARAYPVDALQLDQALLARSDLFFGNWVSTFSSFVAKLRAARGLPVLGARRGDGRRGAGLRFF